MSNLPSSSAPDWENLESFWQKMMAATGEALRHQFAIEHLPLVRQTAARIHARLPNVVELDDLVQVGTLGLYRAMQAYNPRRRVRFSTFAPFYIRGAVFDHLRATDWVPRLVRHRPRLLEEATRQLQQRLGRNPSEQELATHLKLSPAAFARLRKETRGVCQLSLTQTLFTDGTGKTVSPADIQPDLRAPDPVQEAQRLAVKDLITRGLDRAERLVLMLYYYEQMSMKEVGLVLDLSESRVSQLHSSIIGRLKSRLAEEELDIDPER